MCGTLTEQSGLYENMSGRDNPTFFADVFGLKHAKKRIDELVNLFELQDYQHRKVGTYSTGMKKRLGLARYSCTVLPSCFWMSPPMAWIRMEFRWCYALSVS